MSQVAVCAAQEGFSLARDAKTSCAAHTDNRSKQAYLLATSIPNDYRCHPENQMPELFTG